MSATLVIFAGQSPDAPVEWRLVRENGAIDASGLAQLWDLAESGTERCVLILPGESVTAHDTQLAARSERQLLAAAPFAIEDQVACDLDEVHVAVSPARRSEAGGGRTVYVVDAQLLEAWITALGDAGLRASAVFPDFLAIPCTPGRIALAEFPDRLLIRDGDWGAGIDRVLGPQIIDALIEMRAADDARDLVSEELSPEEWRDRMAANAVGLKGGLLQGRLAPRRETGSKGAGDRWQPAGLLVAAAVLSIVALNLVEGIRLRGATETIRAQTERVFQAAFPEIGRVVNPRAQLRAEMRETGGGAPDFLVLSAYIAEAGEAVPSLEVSALRYDGQSGELNVSVLFRSYDDLSRFRGVIESAGGLVEEGGSRQQGDRRAGDIVVKRS